MKNTIITFASALMLMMSTAKSNNISVSAVTFSQAAGTVTFTLAWDNSWQQGTNWDAAWVFVKIRDCSLLTYTHGLVSTILGDHTFGAVLQPTLSDGTAVGIDAATNNTGVMLRRNTLGSGNIAAQTITLKLTNLPAAGTLDVRVFAVEMVFIPTGSFAAGGCDGGANNSYRGFLSTTGTSINITSEGMTFSNRWSSTSSCGVASANGTVQAGFPKGFAPFYIMKYEISQGGYADFLNTVNNALNRYPGQNGVDRHTINASGTPPTTYQATRPDRVCNFLSWTDVTAYLDWAALRPLTEFQYEKAARGGNAVFQYEFAWGTATITNAAAGGISGVENGTETITTPSANICGNNIIFTSGDNGIGPVRTGIFATASTTTRQQTGGSAYGVMELSGNVSEYYIVSDAGITAAVSAGGVSWGDGYVNASAVHDVTNWPDGIAPGTGIIRRGGSWNSSTCATNASTCDAEISHRGMGSSASRDNTIGGRGGR